MKDLITPITELTQADAGIPYNPPAIPVTDPCSLKGWRVAVIASHGCEQIELTYPVEFLEARGAQVDIITPWWLTQNLTAVQFIRPTAHVKITRQMPSAESPKPLPPIKVDDYDMVLIPGGGFNPIVLRGKWNPETGRAEVEFLDFVREADRKMLLIAAICHGPPVLISAGIVKGRKMTGVADIQVDIHNAGAKLAAGDKVKAVRDGNLITAPSPPEIVEFCIAIEQYVADTRKPFTSCG